MRVKRVGRQLADPCRVGACLLPPCPIRSRRQREPGGQLQGAEADAIGCRGRSTFPLCPSPVGPAQGVAWMQHRTLGMEARRALPSGQTVIYGRYSSGKRLQE